MSGTNPPLLTNGITLPNSATVSFLIVLILPTALVLVIDEDGHLGACISDFNDLERPEGQGNNTSKEERHIVSWADECDGGLDNISVVLGLDCELWDSNGGLVNWEKMKESLVVQPLAMANLDVPLVEVVGASMQLSPWVEK